MTVFVLAVELLHNLQYAVLFTMLTGLSIADVPVSEPCPRVESTRGRQPGADNASLVQPQERVPSRLRENEPSLHLGFAPGVSIFLDNLVS